MSEVSTTENSSEHRASSHSSSSNKLLDFKHRPAQILLGLIVVFVILLVVLAFHTSKPTAKAQTAQVSITQNGFSPAMITIPTGTQLTWTNRDTSLHEVAADPFPANNSIPGFNSTITLANNDSYSFRFTKAGTYTYHDQFHPLALLGTVIVK